MIANLQDAYKSRWLAVDTETNALDPRWDPQFKCLGISIAFRNELGVMCSEYYPINHWDSNETEDTINEVRWLITTHPGLVFHNAKFDLVVLDRMGIKPTGDYLDTMLMAHWIDENLFSKELDWLGKRFLGRGKAMTPELDSVINSFGWGLVPGAFMKKYASTDAELTFDLCMKFMKKWNDEGYAGALWAREQEFLALISRMERQGIVIDTDFCKEQIDIGERTMQELLFKVGFNPSSNPQLGEYLINQMGLPVVKNTKTGRPSFDKYAMAEYEEILEQREDATAQNILAYRGWQKTVSSNYRAYLDLLCTDGRLRPNFLLHGTRTGRLSCRKPNLQQIPKSSDHPWNGGLKRAFLGSEGYRLLGFDYSNLELRLAAIYAREDALIDAFNAGFKPFDELAARLNKPRNLCKNLTYAILYGGGINRIKNLFGLDWQAAKELREEFFRVYPNLQETIQYASNLSKRRGYVSLWTERRRHFDRRDDDAHKAFNSIIQGGAAELVKSRQLAVAREIDWDTCRMILSVHDELVFESADPKWEPIIKEIMMDVNGLNPNFHKVAFPVESKIWGLAA